MAEAVMSPVEKLIGMEILGGWKIVDRIEQEAGATGMKNSRCYRVERADGARVLEGLGHCRGPEVLQQPSWLERPNVGVFTRRR